MDHLYVYLTLKLRFFNDMLPPPTRKIQIPSLVSLPVVTCPFD